jgi:recombination protein RecA
LTGIPLLDAFVGSGGFPKYQMEYIWGINSIGKSTLAQQILASYQKQYGANTIAVYFDREESLTKQRLKTLGVDTEKAVVKIPIHIESITEFINMISTKYKNVDIFAIWDTIAMTPAKEETEGYNKIGAQARALAEMFKRLRFGDCNLTMFILNQHREKIGEMFASKDPPGGNATKHKSFLSMHGHSKKSELWPEKANVGRTTVLDTVKSKIISPYRQMAFEFTYVYGYDSILTMINYMWKVMKVLEKTKGRWKFSGEEVTFSLKELYKYFMSDESIYRWKMVIDDIYATLYAQDNITFINEAKERIFNYYFKNDKMNLDKFTSINIAVVNGPDASDAEEADPDVDSIAASLENLGDEK